ncbi:MAG: hypothetical protein GY953_05990 [bacterium]|nr:hypothetical protein [bacterium]
MLSIEIGGMVPGAGFDQLVVEGTARLGGKLILSGIDGYFPADGAQISVLMANATEGQFDQVIASRPSSRQTYDVNVENGSVMLEANRLEPTTYEEWRAGVFTPAESVDPAISGPLADPERDGLVNLFEYVYDRRPKEIDPEPIDRQAELTDQGRVAAISSSSGGGSFPATRRMRSKRVR